MPSWATGPVWSCSHGRPLPAGTLSLIHISFHRLKPVFDGLQKIKLEKPRAKYKAEHEAELKQFYTARRKLTEEFPDEMCRRDINYGVDSARGDDDFTPFRNIMNEYYARDTCLLYTSRCV